jgi:hypothetical protein
MCKYELYIDFDGVILDTIPYLYKAIKEANVDKKNIKEKIKFLASLDFSPIINDNYIINDSINCIKKLNKSNKFNISILTHIESLEEGMLKINYIGKYFKDITVILVPKLISKTKMIRTKNAILVDDYAGNLREWESEGGIGVRFSQELEPKGFLVINKLDQLLDMKFNKETV